MSNVVRMVPKYWVTVHDNRKNFLPVRVNVHAYCPLKAAQIIEDIRKTGVHEFDDGNLSLTITKVAHVNASTHNG